MLRTGSHSHQGNNEIWQGQCRPREYGLQETMKSGKVSVGHVNMVYKKQWNQARSVSATCGLLVIFLFFYLYGLFVLSFNTSISDDCVQSFLNLFQKRKSFVKKRMQFCPATKHISSVLNLLHLDRILHVNQ
jgi:hypothetical protein